MMEKTPLKTSLKSIFKSTYLLGGFAFLGVLLLVLTNQITKTKIEDNQRTALLESLIAVIDKGSYDNDLISDQTTLDAKPFHSKETVTIYRARQQKQPIAAVFVTTSPRGYAGAIKLVVGVRKNLTISGVRVVTHKETPGLGDKMELSKSQWILGFNHKSLEQPMPAHWKVKKDGGEFDQFTGATITPRAIVQAVRDVLLWCGKDNNFDTLFHTPLQTNTSVNTPANPKS